MSTASAHTRRMVQLSLMAAIVVLLSFVPFLGYIPLVVIKATTVHIPVILGAILLGPKAGGILGGVFGITSVIKNTIEPAVVSFCFSPFIPAPGHSGPNLFSLVIAILPRVLVGVVAGWVYRLLAGGGQRQTLACVAASVAGSFTNTLLVMGGIWLFYGEAYAAANNVPLSALSGLILTAVATNGVAEALVAAVLCTLIARPLMGFARPQ